MNFKIGLDGRMMTLKISGIGRYSIHIFQGLSKLDDGPELFIYPSLNSQISAGAPEKASFFSENALSRALFGLPAWIKEKKLDVYLAVNYGSAPLAGASVPWVLTVHDLAPIRHPEFCTRYFALSAGFLLRHNIPRAAHLISDSESTRQEMIDLLKVDPGRISVVHLAVDERFQLPPNPEQEKRICKGLGLDWPYILYVGALVPRKNIPGLLQAYELLIKQGLDHDHRLVLAGAKVGTSNFLFDYVRDHNLSDKAVFLGFVPDEYLPALYRGATAFVYPSFYEGFGYPVLESLCCGTPVITSKSSSLSEVAGPSSLLIDPRSPDEITQAISRVISDSSLRVKMSHEGKSWSENFNWRKTAHETLSVLKKAASG